MTQPLNLVAVVGSTYQPSRTRALVESVIAELGATSKKDMGGVMKAVQERTAGRADNKQVSAEVAKRLP